MRARTPIQAIRTSLTALGALAGAALAGPATADGWDLLAAIEVEEVVEGESWAARKTYPPALVEGAEGFTITGHVVPILPEAELRTFLLVPDPADCPFCGSGGYGPSLEVTMRRPLDAGEGERVTLRGDLEFVADPDTWQAVRLTDAARMAEAGG